MTTSVRTPLAEWRKSQDGSWEPVPTLGPKRAKPVPIPGDPGGGSHFLTPSEVYGGDNVVVVELPDGKLLIEQGGHMVLYEGVETSFRPALDFQGDGVTVLDDPANARTIVRINPGAPDIETPMTWRGDYEPGYPYRVGDVVAFGDGVFIFDDVEIGFGYGFGPYGFGPYGLSKVPLAGFGFGPYGSGPYGGRN